MNILVRGLINNENPSSLNPPSYTFLAHSLLYFIASKNILLHISIEVYFIVGYSTAGGLIFGAT